MGRGADVVRVTVDGKADVINGGPGRDRIVYVGGVDAEDTVLSFERESMPTS